MPTARTVPVALKGLCSGRLEQDLLSFFMMFHSLHHRGHGRACGPSPLTSHSALPFQGSPAASGTGRWLKGGSRLGPGQRPPRLRPVLRACPWPPVRRVRARPAPAHICFSARGAHGRFSLHPLSHTPPSRPGLGATRPGSGACRPAAAHVLRAWAQTVVFRVGASGWQLGLTVLLPDPSVRPSLSTVPPAFPSSGTEALVRNKHRRPPPHGPPGHCHGKTLGRERLRPRAPRGGRVLGAQAADPQHRGRTERPCCPLSTASSTSQPGRESHGTDDGTFLHNTEKTDPAATWVVRHESRHVKAFTVSRAFAEVGSRPFGSLQARRPPPHGPLALLPWGHSHQAHCSRAPQRPPRLLLPPSPPAGSAGRQSRGDAHRSPELRSGRRGGLST